MKRVAFSMYLLILLAACGNKTPQYKKVSYDNMQLEIPLYLSPIYVDNNRLIAENSNNKSLIIEPSLNREFSSWVAGFPLNMDYNEHYVEDNDTCVIVKASKGLFTGYRVYMKKIVGSDTYFLSFISNDNISEEAKHVYNSMALDINQPN